MELFGEISSIVKIEYDNEKIVYLGPEGSYTQEAAINKFGINNLYYSVNSIKNIFYEIDENRATYGVVPIENSSNGIVGDTINSFNTYNLNIIGETVLDIHHTLVSNCKKVEDIKIIYSTFAHKKSLISYILHKNLYFFQKLYLHYHQFTSIA